MIMIRLRIHCSHGAENVYAFADLAAYTEGLIELGPRLNDPDVDMWDVTEDPWCDGIHDWISYSAIKPEAGIWVFKCTRCPTELKFSPAMLDQLLVLQGR
jgi:hypothetical protein